MVCCSDLCCPSWLLTGSQALGVLDQSPSGRHRDSGLTLAAPAEARTREYAREATSHRLCRLRDHHPRRRSAACACLLRQVLRMPNTTHSAGSELGRRDIPVDKCCCARSAHIGRCSFRSVLCLGGQVREVANHPWLAGSRFLSDSSLTLSQCASSSTAPWSACISAHL
jgi:hypothetical protein